MRRLAIFVVMIGFAATAAAQTPPARPATAPTPPTPATPQAIPLPRPALAPMAVIEPWLLEDALRAADFSRLDATAAREAAAQARDALDRARVVAPLAGWHPEDFHFEFDQLGYTRGSESDGWYSSCLSYISSRKYDEAIVRCDRVIAQKGARSDAALYWKAYAQYRLRKNEDALASIAQLRKEYGQSRYLGDAKVLENDIRRVDPANVTDDELKLLAIQAMQHAEPERAIPLLEGVLNATNSLRVKKSALYVLAQSTQPRAHQILLNLAKGQGNPDLQLEAIRYIQTGKDRQTTSAELRQIYESTQDLTVRRAIIDAYTSGWNRSELFAIASTGDAPLALRSQAISGLTSVAAPAELWALYAKESDKNLKMQMISAFGSMQALDQLTQIVKTEKEPTVRARAVRALGGMRPEKTGQMLADSVQQRSGHRDAEGRDLGPLESEQRGGSRRDCAQGGQPRAEAVHRREAVVDGVAFEGRRRLPDGDHQVTRAVLGCLVVVIAATGVGGGQAQPPQQPQQPPASLIQNGKVEVRPGASIDREIGAVAGPDPVWLMWRVPMVAGDRDLCSSSYNERSGYSRGHMMDWNPPGLVTPGSGMPRIAPPTGPVPLEAGTGLLVLVRIVDGGVERVRTLADDCPIDAGGRTVQWLGGVTPAESLRFLDGLTRVDCTDRLPYESRRNMANSALTAISLHRDAAADAILDRIAGAEGDRDLRRQAAAALGSARGAHGFATLKALIAAEKDLDQRRSLVGALGLTREPGTVDALRTLARDADARIRAEAVYWFIQRGGPAVIAEALKVIDTDTDDAVKKRAVSGLARLPANDSVSPLLQLARTSAHAVVRKDAVSALTNSKDPRAMAFMEELIKR